MPRRTDRVSPGKSAKDWWRHQACCCRRSSSTRNDENARQGSQNTPSQRRGQCRRRNRENRGRRECRQRYCRAPAHTLRPQGRRGADRAGRSGQEVRPDHRLCQPADRSRRLGARAQLRHGSGTRRLQSRLPDCPGRQAGERSARRGTGDFPGVPPVERQGRHPQLCRHPDQRELLDHRRRLHRQGDRALGHSRRLPQHRRHRRAEAGQWLRDRLSRRHLRHAEEDHLGLCDQPQHGRRHHGRPRLRGLPDPALQGSLRRRRRAKPSAP